MSTPLVFLSFIAFARLVWELAIPHHAGKHSQPVSHARMDLLFGFFVLALLVLVSIVALTPPRLQQVNFAPVSESVVAPSGSTAR